MRGPERAQVRPRIAARPRLRATGATQGMRSHGIGRPKELQQFVLRALASSFARGLGCSENLIESSPGWPRLLATGGGACAASGMGPDPASHRHAPPVASHRGHPKNPFSWGRVSQRGMAVRSAHARVRSRAGFRCVRGMPEFARRGRSFRPVATHASTRIVKERSGGASIPTITIELGRGSILEFRSWWVEASLAPDDPTNTDSRTDRPCMGWPKGSVLRASPSRIERVDRFAHGRRVRGHADALVRLRHAGARGARGGRPGRLGGLRGARAVVRPRPLPGAGRRGRPGGGVGRGLCAARRVDRTRRAARSV